MKTDCAQSRAFSLPLAELHTPSEQGFAARCVLKEERAELAASFLWCCSTLRLCESTPVCSGWPGVTSSAGEGWRVEGVMLLSLGAVDAEARWQHPACTQHPNSSQQGGALPG